MANIGIINSVYKSGSTGRIVFELQTYLNDNSNNKAIVYFGRGEKCNEEGAFNFSYPLSVMIHGALSRIFDRSGFYSYFSTKRLIRRMNKDKINTVFLVNVHGYYLNLKVLFNYLKKKNIKVFISMEDCWLLTGHCSHFVIFNCEKWKTCCNHCEHLDQYPKSILFDSSKKNYLEKKKLLLSVNPTLILPCDWLSNLVNYSYLRNQKKITIRNGINTSVFKNTKSDFREKYGLVDKKIILCVSQFWIEKKGIYDILKLGELLPDGYVIVLVGKLNVNVELSHNIIHIPQTDSVEEIVKIYSASDVFFNPTYEDTYPTVNIEALACDLPIVCYRTGGAVESVDKNYVVEQRNIEESIKKLTELCADPSRFVKPDIKISKQDVYSAYLNLLNDWLRNLKNEQH